MAVYRPKVILSAAASIDGKIATKTGDSKFSSKIDKIRVHKLRSQCDAILVGINTVKKDDPLLTVRYHTGKNPTRVILDSKAEISPKSKIIRTASVVPTIIAVSNKAPQKKLRILSKYSLQVVKSGEKIVDIKKLLGILYKKGIRTVLVEGGGTTNWSFVEKKLVDEIILTISPYVVGGLQAVSLVEGAGFARVCGSLRLRLRSVKKQNNELVLHYQR